MLNGCKVSVWGNEKVMETGSVDGCMTLCEANVITTLRKLDDGMTL